MTNKDLNTVTVGDAIVLAASILQVAGLIALLAYITIAGL